MAKKRRKAKGGRGKEAEESKKSEKAEHFGEEKKGPRKRKMKIKETEE